MKAKFHGAASAVVSKSATGGLLRVGQSGIKAVIIPGNGDDDPKDKWFPFVERELGKIRIQVINVKFPDAVLARRRFWLPFIKKLGADEKTILIGHSSGAIAAMRFAEKNKILGSVLVGAYVSDLGEESEKRSGYFDEGWDFEKIRANQKWVVQFASKDDPFIPISEARHVRDNLNTDYYEYSDQGHFGSRDGKTEFPEMIRMIKRKLNL